MSCGWPRKSSRCATLPGACAMCSSRHVCFILTFFTGKPERGGANPGGGQQVQEEGGPADQGMQPKGCESLEQQNDIHRLLARLVIGEQQSIIIGMMDKKIIRYGSASAQSAPFRTSARGPCTLPRPLAPRPAGRKGAGRHPLRPMVPLTPSTRTLACPAPFMLACLSCWIRLR